MEQTTTAPDASIAAFAAAVRASLDDLPADEIDELVEGLESDLLDQASDRGEDFVLGDPETYAAELRAAAGIPPRSERADERRRLSSVVSEWSTTTWRSAVELMRRNAAAAWVIDLLVALRPVWWVARGWAMYAIIAPILGIGLFTAYQYGPTSNVIGVAVLSAFIVLSVQWGRGRWAPRRWIRGLRFGVSVVTAILLPFLIGWTVDAKRIEQVNEMYSPDYAVPGLAVDGERVRNIFAYDSEGNPLTDVQLFDQNGRPLTTVGTQYVDPTTEWDNYFDADGAPVPVAVTTPGRAPAWNIFPLREARIQYDSYGNADVSSATIPDFPFPQVPAVGGSSSPAPTPPGSPSTAPETTPPPTP
jgi:uncharacterized membrane protein